MSGGDELEFLTDTGVCIAWCQSMPVLASGTGAANGSASSSVRRSLFQAGSMEAAIDLFAAWVHRLSATEVTQ
jgi:hypothetical protein